MCDRVPGKLKLPGLSGDEYGKSARPKPDDAGGDMKGCTGRPVGSLPVGRCHCVCAETTGAPPSRDGVAIATSLGPLCLVRGAGGWCEGVGDQFVLLARGGVCMGLDDAMLSEGRLGGALLERLFGRTGCVTSRDR